MTTSGLKGPAHRLVNDVKVALGGMFALCLMQLACTNPRQPDLSSLESPGGAQSCARQVSVGSGIVHVLAVVGRDVAMSACATAEATLQPLSSAPAAELPQEIRGRWRCSLIGDPSGASGEVYKVYVYADGAADSAAKKVCDELLASADPSFDFQSS